MEPKGRTAETLRSLVQDLDEKLAPARNVPPHIDELESLVPNRRVDDINGLVTDLDSKLSPGRSTRDVGQLESVKATTRHYTRGLPVWVAAVAVAVLLLGLAAVLVRPWSQGCEFEGDLCKIAALDVDLLNSRIPESAITSTLPQLEVLDPDNVLTFGDVFAMDSYADIDFEELLTDGDIDRLLGSTG